MSGVVGVLLVVGTVLLAGVSPAAAHAELLASTPQAGDVVSAEVGRVELVFGEDLLPEASELVVRGPGGSPVGAARPRVAGATIAVELPRLSPGTHVVAYRVTSVDGHPVTGEYRFTVRAAPGASGSQGTGGDEVALDASVAAPGATDAEAPAAPQGRWIVAAALLGALVLVVHRLRAVRTDEGTTGRVV